MVFRILLVLLALAAAYATYEIITARQYYSTIRNTDADFAVLNGGNQSALTIVEFLNYECGACKRSHLVMLDFAKKNPDIRIVTRPLPDSYKEAETAAERAMSAGMQGKFAEVDRTLAEYEGTLDEKFWRETASLYDIDYARMVAEAEGEKVQNILKDNVRASVKAGIQTTPSLMIGKTVYQLDKPLTLPDLIRMVQTEKAR